MNFERKIFNLKYNFLLLTFLVIAVSLAVTDFLISTKVTAIAHDNLQTKVIEIADITANTPVVIDALAGGRKDDQKALQEFTEKISAISGVRFITVMDMQKIRKTHPDSTKLGLYYQNHDGDVAFEGEVRTSIDNGSLGRSLRAFVPVYASDGRQVGVVLVGVMLDEVDAAVAKARQNLLFGSFCGLLVGILGALFLANHIKKFTFGLEPFAMAKILEERNAILASIREGAIAIDEHENITMVNKAAHQLFEETKICPNLIGRKVEDVVPNSRMKNVLQTGMAELDQEQNLHGRTILTNRTPIIVNNQIVGVVATFRDKSEMCKLAEKLVDLKIYAEALRAQTHEFMNKLHVIVGLTYLENYTQLKEYISQIAHKYQTEVGAVAKIIRDPVLAGFLLGKLSLARESGVKMQLSEECIVPDLHDAEIVHDIITIVGNLVNNALDALKKVKKKEIYLKIVTENDVLKIEIRDTGEGIEQEKRQEIYQSTYSTKGRNRGFGLYITKCSVERWGGTIKVISEKGTGTTFYVNLPYKCEERFFD